MSHLAAAATLEEKQKWSRRLWRAVQKASLSAVERLVTSETAAQMADQPLHAGASWFDWTPLHLACVIDIYDGLYDYTTITTRDDTHCDIIQLLLMHYRNIFADEQGGFHRAINALTRDGDTPLHVAAHSLFVNAMYDLLAAGAFASALNRYGKTPLVTLLEQHEESRRHMPDLWEETWTHVLSLKRMLLRREAEERRAVTATAPSDWMLPPRVPQPDLLAIFMLLGDERDICEVRLVCRGWRRVADMALASDHHPITRSLGY